MKTKTKCNKISWATLSLCLKDGNYDAIPKSYNIIWRTQKPYVEYTLETTGDNITILKDSMPKPVPRPTKVIFIAEYVPDTSFLLSGVNYLDYVEPGDIEVDIHFKPTIKFIYETSDKNVSGQEFMEWLRMYAESITGRRINWDEVTVDIEIDFPSATINAKRLIPGDTFFMDLTNDSTYSSIEVTFQTDYVFITPKNEEYFQK